MNRRRDQQERLPGNSLAAFTMHRLVSNPLCSLRTNFRRAEEALDVIAAKLRRKNLVEKLIQEGRANNAPYSFYQAIYLKSYPARADFALVCFTSNQPHRMCKYAFEKLKDGHKYGCPDCTGMLAFFHLTGCRRVTTQHNDYAYSLACQSAAAGSLFGKMTLVHILNSLLGFQDPDEEKFDVLWTDPFIQNFAGLRFDVLAPSPAAAAEVSFKVISDLPIDLWGTILQKTRSFQECEKLYSALPIQFRAELKDLYESHKEALALEEFFEPDRNILSNSDIRRIARILIEEIQQEHQRNPHMPNVWCNLPPQCLF